MANCVIIGNNGGSSSDVNIISQAEWDAMSFEEKKTSGFTVVSDEESITGKWYDYTSAPTEAEYLPNSVISNIITFANTDNFDSTSLSWGTGTSPVLLQDYKAIDEETGSVLIDALTSESCGYVDLGQGNKPVTIYAVMKITSGYSSYWLRHLSLMTQKNTDYGLITYGDKNALYFGTYDNETAIPINSTEFYAIGFNFNGSTAYANINGISCTKIISTISQYLTIGKTIYSNDNNSEYEYPSDVYVKFLGIVDHAESKETIASNVQNLMNKYNITM